MTTPYSYRDNPSVPPFDDSAPIVIFDGLCVLCSTGVQWMLARNPNGMTRFAAIQDPIPQALYAHYGLDATTFDTFMVLADGVALTKWAGVLAAGKTMSRRWRWLATTGRLVPDFAGDKIYDLVQRNRLRWFGSRATCLMPEPANRHRFLLTSTAERVQPTVLT
jgi:predicted DCC family thiol-disulfide oxidoreductase YuxK